MKYANKLVVCVIHVTTLKEDFKRLLIVFMLHVIFFISLADADSITEFTLKSLSIIMVNLFFSSWELGKKDGSV